MRKPHDDWDAEERDAFAGFEAELAELRRRHEGDPSLALLRAADADALPPELQAQVAQHLKDSAWSRTLVDGLREAAADDQLDFEQQRALFARIMREARVAATPAPSRRWMPALLAGGLAMAAVVLLAVLWPRATATPPANPPDALATPAAPPAAEVIIAFAKPDVKLSASALTWRAGATNPFITDIAPAFEAYRGDDYAKAAAMFEQLLVKYPNAIELLFYRGASLLLAGNAAAAIAPLDAAARVGDPAFNDDAAWSLAVARQHAGSRDAGAFEALCRGGGAYAERACAAATRLRAASSPQP